jgi:hypothetical protein
MKTHILRTLAIMFLGAGTSLHAATILFGLLNDPIQNYTFSRTDSPAGQSISDPVGPYPAFLGADIPADLYGVICLTYLNTANWDTTYTGTLYHIGDTIAGETQAQELEAAYLSDELYQLGGSSASLSLYQGPISFAIWQIMDPKAGDVPRDAAAQPWVTQAQNLYNAGSLKSSMYANTLVFVPDNPAIQAYMTVSGATPEPQTISLAAGGALLILIGKFRRPRR